MSEISEVLLRCSQCNLSFLGTEQDSLLIPNQCSDCNGLLNVVARKCWKLVRRDAVNIVKLKNGSREADVLVVATMLTLNGLFDRMPRAIYELVMLCRDCDHKPFGPTAKELVALSLATRSGSKWQVHESTRNIVLSAVNSDDLEHLTLSNPIFQETDNGCDNEKETERESPQTSPDIDPAIAGQGVQGVCQTEPAGDQTGGCTGDPHEKP